jgi:hypothetical protein
LNQSIVFFCDIWASKSSIFIWFNVCKKKKKVNIFSGIHFIWVLFNPWFSYIQKKNFFVIQLLDSINVNVLLSKCSSLFCTNNTQCSGYLKTQLKIAQYQIQIGTNDLRKRQSVSKRSWDSWNETVFLDSMTRVSFHLSLFMSLDSPRNPSF